MDEDGKSEISWEPLDLMVKYSKFHLVSMGYEGEKIKRMLEEKSYMLWIHIN